MRDSRGTLRVRERMRARARGRRPELRRRARRGHVREVPRDGETFDVSRVAPRDQEAVRVRAVSGGARTTSETWRRRVGTVDDARARSRAGEGAAPRTGETGRPPRSARDGSDRFWPSRRATKFVVGAVV